jgi:hypothetical protein
MLSTDKEFYEKLSKQELSEKEVFEAKSNFVGFFDLLYCIDKRLNESSACTTDGSDKGKISFKERQKVI